MTSTLRKRVITTGVSFGLLALLVVSLAVTYFPSENSANGPQTTATGAGISTATTGSYQEYSLAACDKPCVVSPPWHIYSSMSELKEASLFVVEGEVVQESVVSVMGLPITYYNLTISQAVEANSNVTAGQDISFAEIGGSLANETVVVSGYPTLSLGQTYVIFLAYPGSNFEPYLGSYLYPVGGPQGTFIVESGSVYSLNTIFPNEDSWLPIQVGGTPLSQFVSEIGAA